MVVTGIDLKGTLNQFAMLLHVLCKLALYLILCLYMCIYAGYGTVDCDDYGHPHTYYTDGGQEASLHTKGWAEPHNLILVRGLIIN